MTKTPIKRNCHISPRAYNEASVIEYNGRRGIAHMEKVMTAPMQRLALECVQRAIRTHKQTGMVCLDEPTKFPIYYNEIFSISRERYEDYAQQDWTIKNLLRIEKILLAIGQLDFIRSPTTSMRGTQTKDVDIFCFPVVRQWTKHDPHALSLDHYHGLTAGEPGLDPLNWKFLPPEKSLSDVSLIYPWCIKCILDNMENLPDEISREDFMINMDLGLGYGHYPKGYIGLAITPFDENHWASSATLGRRIRSGEAKLYDFPTDESMDLHTEQFIIAFSSSCENNSGYLCSTGGISKDMRMARRFNSVAEAQKQLKKACDRYQLKQENATLLKIETRITEYIPEQRASYGFGAKVVSGLNKLRLEAIAGPIDNMEKKNAPKM